MPQFFVPHVADAAEAERIWQNTKAFMENNEGYTVNDRRIYAVSYSHDGKNYKDVVGEINALVGEEVLVILDAQALFLVCTKNRGLLRGGPFMVGKHSNTSETEFLPSETQSN